MGKYLDLGRDMQEKNKSNVCASEFQTQMFEKWSQGGKIVIRLIWELDLVEGQHFKST